MATVTFDEDFLKDVLSDVTKLMDLIIKLVDSVGGIPTLIAGIGTAYGLMNKKFGNIGFTAESLKNIKENFANLKTTLNDVGKLSADTGTKVKYSANKLIQKVFGKSISSNYKLSNYSSNFFRTGVINDKYFQKSIERFNNSLNDPKKMDKYRESVSKTDSVMKQYLKTRADIGAKASKDSYIEFLQNSGRWNGLSGAIQALKDYNSLASKNATISSKANKAQLGFVNTLATAKPNVANVISSLNKANISLGEYIGKLALSKVATLALSLASAMLNAVIGGLISMIAMKLISGLVNWWKGLNKVSDATVKANEDIKNLTSEVESYTEKLQELKKAQEEANASGTSEDIVNANKELISLQDEIIEAYGSQVNGINLVNGSLEDELDLLKQINAENASQYIQENTKDINKAQKKIYGESVFDNLNDNQYYIGINYKDIKDITKIVNDLNLEPTGYSNGIMFLTLDLDENSIMNAKEKLQEFYDDVANYGQESNINVSEILSQIQSHISKYSTDDFEDIITTNNTYIQSFIDSYSTKLNGKTLSEWQEGLNDLISQYNEAKNEQDYELMNTLMGSIDLYYKNLSQVNLDEIIDVQRNKKVEGLSNYFENLFSNFYDTVVSDDDYKAFSKFIMENIDGINQERSQQLKDLKNFFNTNNLTKNDVIKEIQEKGEYAFSEYNNKSFDNLLSVIDGFYMSLSNGDKINVPWEKMLDYLDELGYFTTDISTYEPTISNIITEINDVTKSVAEDLGASTDGVEKVSDSLGLIKDAYSEIGEQGYLSDKNILQLYQNGYGSAIEKQQINQNGAIIDVYTLERKELEKLIKAKYDELKVDALKKKSQLEIAKNNDLKKIENQTDSNIKAMMKVKFDSAGYDDVINELNAIINSIDSNYSNIEQEISPSKLANTQIKGLKDEFQSISDIFTNLRKGTSLTADEMGTMIDNGYESALVLDDETGLITINTKKYKELAQAKIDAYKIDTTETIKNLLSEQEQLKSNINTYNAVLNSGTSSISDKAYASQELAKSTAELETNTQALEENEYVLSTWSDLESRIPSIINGGFSDLLSKSKEIESSASTMSSAFKEVNDNGYLSLGTMMNLIDSGYAKCIELDKETGLLTLNARAYKDLAEAEIDEQIATLQTIVANGQATQQIYDQIQALQTLKNNIAMVTTGSYGDNTDYWKAEAEEQFAYLEHLHNMNIIDNAHYYKYLNDLNEEYYANRIKYIDDYRKYEEEIYKGLIEAQKELIENQKENLESQKDYLNDQKDALQDQIDSIEDEKDYWNDQKDAIQDQIDLLQEKNDEEERALKLKEAQIALQNALNQKTIRVFTEELGWQWEVDKDAIAEAQKDLDEALRDEEIARLEKEQDAIDDIIDGLDDQIDSLKDQQEAIDKEIEAIDKQEEILDKQISALESQLNASHYDELTGLNNTINEFTKLSQENINKLLGLPENFNTSLNTTISEPIKNLKNSVDLTNQALDDLKNQNSIGSLFKTSGQISETLTVNIDQIVTSNAYDFVDQLSSLLKSQL